MGNNIIVSGPTTGEEKAIVASIVQGATPEVLPFTWRTLDGNPYDLTGATLSGTYSDDLGNVYSITGSLDITDAAAGSFTWDPSAADVGTPGIYNLRFKATVGAESHYSLAATWYIEKSPGVTAVSGAALVGVPEEDAAWLAAAQATGNNLTDYLLLAGGTMTGDLAFTNAAISNVDSVLFNTAFSDGSAEGRLQWNSTDGVLEFGLPGGDVNLQIGQEELFFARNNSGATITNGTPVAITGAVGGRPAISPADADDAALYRVSGVATEDIENNTNGYVASFGLVRDLNTSAYNAGDSLYLSTTAGQFTTTAPAAPVDAFFVGTVITAHPTTGIILVHPGFYNDWSRIDGRYLQLAGGTMAGNLTLDSGVDLILSASSEISGGNIAITTTSGSGGDITLNPDGSGRVSVASARITSVADAVSATDALNRQTGDARYLLLSGGGSVSGSVTISDSTATTSPLTVKTTDDSVNQYVFNVTDSDDSTILNVYVSGATNRVGVGGSPSYTLDVYGDLNIRASAGFGGGGTSILGRLYAFSNVTTRSTIYANHTTGAGSYAVIRADATNAAHDGGLIDLRNSSGIAFLIQSDGKINTNQASANTNTPSGATAQQLPIYNAAGTLLGYIPVYGSAW